MDRGASPLTRRVVDAVTARLPSGLYVTGAPEPPPAPATPPPGPRLAATQARWRAMAQRADLAAAGRLPDQQGRPRWPGHGRSRARRTAQRLAAQRHAARGIPVYVGGQLVGHAVPGGVRYLHDGITADLTLTP